MNPSGHVDTLVLTVTVVFSGRNGKPAAQPGRDSPGGNLRVFPASVRERDPVQKSKLLPIDAVVSAAVGAGGEMFSHLQSSLYRSGSAEEVVINSLPTGQLSFDLSLCCAFVIFGLRKREQSFVLCPHFASSSSSFPVVPQP